MNIPIAGASILIADDSRITIEVMRIFLKGLGYDVLTAYDGSEALDMVYKYQPDLVILDIMMPNLSGLEVCKIIKSNEQIHFTPVIVLTTSDSRDDKNNAISEGANDFINKPFDPTELRLKVESLLKLKRAIDELENANNIILTLARAIEAKDKYTEGHVERVSLYGAQIARELKLSEQQVKDIISAGILHDIGKIGVPDTILNKPGTLTKEEFEIVMKHPEIGEEICIPMKSFSNVRKIIRHHHEKLSGKGYPDGISGNAISIETRIITVADIYDALVSQRPYRLAIDRDNAFRILKQAVSDGELDGKVVSILESIVSRQQLGRFDEQLKSSYMAVQ